MKKFLPFLLLLVSCETVYQKEKEVIYLTPVTPEKSQLELIVGSFEELYELKLEGYTFNFQAEEVLGNCQDKVVSLNQETWDSTDEQGKEILVFHALGHCVFNRGHRMDFNVMNGCPRSIMYPDFETLQSCFKTFEGTLKDELQCTNENDTF